jgi:hypothetical protein
MIFAWIKSLAALILGTGAVAIAAPKPGSGADEISAWLASVACPDYLTGDYDISDNAELKGLGFSSVPSRSSSQRFGELEVVVRWTKFAR